MLIRNRDLPNLTVDTLLKFSGTHARDIHRRSCENYKKRLTDIFANGTNDDCVDVILPGFPYKSANAVDKVMGKLPDLGEEKALERLDKLRRMLTKRLKRRVRIVICSDGFAFNDIKGVPDDDVVNYRKYLSDMAKKHDDILVKGLSDFIDADTNIAKRLILDNYGPSLDGLSNDVRTDESLMMLYNNLATFAKHDLIMRPDESGKAFKRRCRNAALRVLARSKAWANLIATNYPNAIRVSIHPYRDVSEKFPIMLVPAYDKRWRTPWHNVPIISGVTPFNTSVKLIHRKHAEADGALMTLKDDRPWCYVSRETRLLEDTMRYNFL